MVRSCLIKVSTNSSEGFKSNFHNDKGRLLLREAVLKVHLFTD